MRSPFPLKSRSLPRRPRATRSRRMSLECLEGRELLTAVGVPSGLISWWTADGTAAERRAGTTPACLTARPTPPARSDRRSASTGSTTIASYNVGTPDGKCDRPSNVGPHRSAGCRESFFASYGTPGSTNQVDSWVPSPTVGFSSRHEGQRLLVPASANGRPPSRRSAHPTWPRFKLDDATG